MRATLASLLLAAVLGVAVASAGAGTSGSEARSLAAKPDLGRAILVEMNAVRARRGLRPLRLSVALGRAARGHTFAMARKGFFSHASADGSAFSSRVRRHYPARGFREWRAGENLLWASPDVRPDQAVRMWLQSPPHRRILLAPGWREAGLSAVHATTAGGDFGGREVTIVTANFGARAR